MPQRNVATNFTFEQQRQEINLLAADFTAHETTVNTAAPTYLKHDGSNAFTGGTLNVPNAFTISANSGSGTLTISGNLDVTGTTTTVNTANLEVTDKNILIAKGSTSDAQADGAGITIDSATDITFNFVDANDALVSSIGLEATTFLKAARGQFTGDTSPTTGSGVEVNAPDANTGQIIAYNRGTSTYNELRLRAASVPIYTGTTNALVGTFNSTGLTVDGSLTTTGDVTITGANKVFKTESSAGDYWVKMYAAAGTGKWDIYANGNNLRFSEDSNNGGGIAFDRPVIVGTTTIEHQLGVLAANSATPRIGIQNPDNDENFNISTYHDSDGLYTLIGSNAKLDASGNYAVDTTAHKATGIHLDARNNGYVAILTGVAGDGLNERVRVQDDGKIKLGTGGDNVNPANVEIRYADPVLLIRDEAATSVKGDAKIGFGNESHYPVAFISHEWTAGEKGALTFHTRSGGSESEKVRITADGKVGIGDDDPDALLSIKGDSNGDSTPSIRLKDGTDTREAWMSNQSGDLLLAAGGNDNVYHSRIRLMDGKSIYCDVEGKAQSLSINSSGYVTKPYTPLAIIGTTINNHTPTAGSIIQFDYAQTNRGNHYDTSTYKWTCPVDGDYMVIFNHAVSGWVGDIALMKNTTDIRKLEMRENGANKDGDSDWQAGSYSFIIPCNANDELWWKVTNVYSNTGMGGAGAMLDGYNHVYYDSVTYYLMG